MDPQKHARPVQRRAQGLQRIASILDAAETIFAHMGYDEATTNHIAAQAGISPGSLYQFFSNKEEIAQALAARYAEELQQVYDSVFSVEAASLPFSLWLDQIIDALLAFHFAHPAFHILLNTPVSSHVTSLTRALPQELQARFELGFERRAPTLSPMQRRLSAMMSVQLFKAVLPLSSPHPLFRASSVISTCRTRARSPSLFQKAGTTFLRSFADRWQALSRRWQPGLA
jgi:AcrR family transcriptional regulator